TDWLRRQLDEVANEPVAATASTAEKVSNVLFIGGTGASAGYVLLSSRGSSFLLSAPTARPPWRQFAPMGVLFAWELANDRRRPLGLSAEEEEEEEDREPLQSLVG